MLRILKIKNLFRRLMVSYLFVLIVPLAIGSFLYVRVAGIIRQDTITANTAMLRQARDIIEVRLVELEHMTTELSLNNSVQYLLTAGSSIEGKNLYPVVETRKSLPNFALNNELIERIEKANRFLLEQNGSISDISQRVGYANTNTFRRAYKRIMGCSPSEFTQSTKKAKGASL